MKVSRFGSKRALACIIVGGAAVLAAAIALPAAMASPSASGSTSQPASCTSGTTVSTASGPVCGFVSNGLTEWLGIPYAAPPVGSLRWQPPQPPPPWTTTLQALHYSDACPQSGSEPGQGPTPVPQSEDCLYLNVIAPPHASGTQLPVLVWIHGGGFQGGATAIYPGNHLAQAGHVIFVSMNYRLGVLGFLATSAFGAHAGDYGLQDQQAALRWVQTNIAKFGGNPRNVTIFGESAGGSSVCDQVSSPTAAGLFQKAISESGFYNSITGVNTEWQPQDCKSALATEAQADAAGQAFAQKVGCTNAADLASCLRSVPVSTLLADSGGPTGGTNSPIVNGTTLTASPRTAFATGRFNRVPMIMGTLRDENLIASPTTTAQFLQDVKSQYEQFAPLVLAAYPLSRYGSPYIDFRTIVADSDTICPAVRTEANISRHTRLYAYEIDDTDPPALAPSSLPMGAFHGGELVLLFPQLNLSASGLTTPTLDANQQALSNQMTAEWTTFARTGDPTAVRTPLWTAFRADGGTVMSLQPAGDSQLTTVGQLALVHNCGLWDALAARGA
jgi:para-nitrobenzyl esterase